MGRRLSHPEDVSHDHIEATIMDFPKGERDADRTEASFVTLHPREEPQTVLKCSRDRYRSIEEGRFRELVTRLKAQGVPW